MKRYWILTLIGLVLCLGVAWAMKSMPRLLSDEECSLIYQRYADDPGIEASFVKGFRVNDTLAIDATLLHATDSAGWERLREELNLPKPNTIAAEFIKKGKDIIITYMTKKGGASKYDMDKENLNNNDIVGVSYLTQSIAIYHLSTWEQRIAVKHYNYDLSTSTNKEQKQ
ncbi:MAG: hypothetical protein J6X88_08260 [Bacteroidales bacterium]|nr:hypothetical protein [Bacteroidales bacterium]